MRLSFQQISFRLLPVLLAATAVFPSHAQEAVPATPSAARALTGVQINGPSMIYAGQSAQFKALATYSDNTTEDMTGAVSWSVLQTAVGKFSSGALTGINPGVLHAQATLNGVQTATPVIVNSNRMVQIYPSMSQGQIQDAVNKSSAGDVLYFNSGIYRISLLKLLPGRTYFGSLYGDPAVLSGAGGSALMTFSGSGVIVQHFTFDGGGVAFVGPVSGVNVEYNTFRNIDALNYANWTTSNAIFMDTSAANSDFSYNTFSNLGHYVLNQFQDQLNATGIFGYGLSNVTIEHNTFDTFDEGIHIFYDHLDGNNVKIDYNTFTNGHRIAIEQQDNKAAGLEIAYNTVSHPLNAWALTYAVSVATPGATGVSIHDNHLNADTQLASACTGSGCHYGYGIEAWGTNTQVVNNFVEGGWINGVAVNVANNLRVVNNILCGPTMAQQGFIVYESSQRSGTIIQGNTTSSAMTCDTLK